MKDHQYITDCPSSTLTQSPPLSAHSTHSSSRVESKAVWRPSSLDSVAKRLMTGSSVYLSRTPYYAFRFFDRGLRGASESDEEPSSSASCLVLDRFFIATSAAGFIV